MEVLISFWPVARLTDFGNGDKTKVEKMRRSEILKAGRLFTMADFTRKTEADIEDVFELDVYVAILNGTYGLSGINAVTAANLDAADTNTPRLVQKAKALFRQPQSQVDFDHFAPSAWLLYSPDVLRLDASAIITTLVLTKHLRSGHDRRRLSGFRPWTL